MTSSPQHGSARGFDQDYWDQHYRDAEIGAHGSPGPGTPNPHLPRETAALMPGAALDAGCGEAPLLTALGRPGRGPDREGRI